MPELERDLARLAAELEWPATPDLAGPALEGLAHARPPGRRFGLRPPWGRRALATALTAAFLGVPAAAVAFPEARNDVLEWLGLRNVAVERRSPSPPATAPPAGERVGQAAAARRAGFTPLVPPAFADAPAEVREGRITLLAGALRLEQRPGGLDGVLLRKLVATAAGVERVTVAGAPALWFPRPHAYLWVDPAGGVREEPPARSGPSLVYERDGLVLRLEGPALTRERALAIARAGPVNRGRP